ncbi:hypothetical protein [Actibacterium sp. XHP0104]|uniref:hypothetical protein n=1 Tax=Actibacterium sp. XHP0104 TaxID=2984335 RepID=UPI0021E7E718|nr:hypothetical protein [Actibacterium sp. XHP0104]MCV2880772.1 hypothetical protein [Actibacterium sp. XHP0104]
MTEVPDWTNRPMGMRVISWICAGYWGVALLVHLAGFSILKYFDSGFTSQEISQMSAPAKSFLSYFLMMQAMWWVGSVATSILVLRRLLKIVLWRIQAESLLFLAGGIYFGFLTYKGLFWDDLVQQAIAQGPAWVWGGVMGFATMAYMLGSILAILYPRFCSVSRKEMRDLNLRRLKGE